jgi:cell pole-organizing protein PopZ
MGGQNHHIKMAVPQFRAHDLANKGLAAGFAFYGGGNAGLTAARRYHNIWPRGGQIVLMDAQKIQGQKFIIKSGKKSVTQGFDHHRVNQIAGHTVHLAVIARAVIMKPPDDRWIAHRRVFLFEDSPCFVRRVDASVQSAYRKKNARGKAPMSTAQKQVQDEESIEGILLSIREIMMNDGAEEAGATRTMDDAPVLDLTQLIRDNGQIQEIPKPKAPIPEDILKEIDKNNFKNKQLAESILQKQAEAKNMVFEDQQPDAVHQDFASQDVFDDQIALNEIADMLEEDLPDVQSLSESPQNEESFLEDEEILDIESNEAIEPLKTEDDGELFSLDISEDDEDLSLDHEGEDVTESLLLESMDQEDVQNHEEALLGQDALASSLRALDRLDVAVAQTRLKPDPLFDQDDAIGTSIPSKSLEDVIVQAVQPYLKAWLNTHLPTIVEQKVQEEIRRLVNKKLGSS